MIYKTVFFSLFRNKDFKGAIEIDYHGKHVFGKGERVYLKINDKRFFKRVILHGDTGFGESYFLGEFETHDLYNLIAWFIMNRDKLPVSYSPFYKFEWAKISGQIDHFLKKNTRKGSRKNISSHYDLSNRFYQLWLDETMTYSCAVFEGNMTLQQAQENKYRKICEKLELQPEDHLLEIGTGWGGFAEYAKKNYGSKITTVTISEKQYNYAKARGIDVRFQDYRDIKGKYSKIASIEMMEALGHEYVPLFIRKCSSLLEEKGRMALQFITCPDEHFKTYLKNPGFIKKHIFPGGELLSLGQVKKELKKNHMKLVVAEEIGKSYVKTLLAWRNNFVDHKKEVLALGFDENFYRKWYYYLTSCAVGFDTGYTGDVQLLALKA